MVIVKDRATSVKEIKQCYTPLDTFTHVDIIRVIRHKYNRKDRDQRKNFGVRNTTIEHLFSKLLRNLTLLETNM